MPDPSNGMVERVARALHLLTAETGADPTWDDLPQIARDDFRFQARAAIAAMREPDEAMLRACPLNPIEARSVWRAAIDTALSPSLLDDETGGGE